MNSVLRLLLLIWVVGFPVLSCGGLFSGDAGSAGLGLLLGAVFLVPWLVGTLALAVLVWFTNPRRPI